MDSFLLTARRIYMLLARGSERGGSVPFLSGVTRYTLTHFWWAFLSECVPDSVLSPYFETTQKRSRALSSLMNRSASRSMPVKLYQALEEHLTVDELLQLVGWMAAALDQDVHPRLIHRALDALEDEAFREDPVLEGQAEFFRSLRPAAGRETDDLKQLRLRAALRLTLLGLHALYGDHMNDSEALRVLRSSRACHAETLQLMAAERSPRLSGDNFSHVLAAERVLQEENAPQTLSGEALLGSAAACFRGALPEKAVLAARTGPNAGWYIVANWTDLSISVNARPLPSYDGGEKQGELENGTLVYVLSAPGYRGLHVSAGVWGLIQWKGQPAYIPMNLTVRLKT